MKGIFMDIKVLELIDGAKQAEGLTVVIDVFRAFSLEAYLISQGAERIYPIGEMEEAFEMKRSHPDWLLFGERGGAKVEGCDFGISAILQAVSQVWTLPEKQLFIRRAQVPRES